MWRLQKRLSVCRHVVPKLSTLSYEAAISRHCKYNIAPRSYVTRWKNSSSRMPNAILITPFHAQSMEINIEHFFRKLNAFRCKIYYYWLTEHFVWRHTLTHANKYMPEYKTNPAPLSALQSLTISFRSVFLFHFSRIK